MLNTKDHQAVLDHYADEEIHLPSSTRRHCAPEIVDALNAVLEQCAALESEASEKLSETDPTALAIQRGVRIGMKFAARRIRGCLDDHLFV